MSKQENRSAIMFGRCKHIGIAIDDSMVVYVNLLSDGTINLRWVVDKEFIDNREVFSIHSKSDKEYLVADMAVSNGKNDHRVNSLNLAKMVYEFSSEDTVSSWQVMHHLLGQLICLSSQMVKMEKAEHDALHALNSDERFNMSVGTFFKRYVMTEQQYGNILKPNLKLILSWMLENKKYSNFVSVGDVCLYETRLDSIDNWQSLIAIK